MDPAISKLYLALNCSYIRIMTTFDYTCWLLATSTPTQLVPTAWSVVSSFIIALGGWALISMLARSLGHSASLGAGLYAWHTFFCLVYAWYVLQFGGDATAYYSRAVEGGTRFDLGTSAIEYLAELSIQTTGTSFLGVSLFFNLAGAVGLLLLYDTLADISARGSSVAGSLVWPMVLMPSASFWSSGLGKDGIAFMAASAMTWAALDLGRRRGAVVLAIASMFIVRPHVGTVAIAMLLVAALGTPGRRLADRVVHAAIVGLIVTIALPVATEYAGLGDAQSFGDVDSYIEQRQQYNQDGEAGVDISTLPLPLQVVTYMYRPLPHEAWSVFALMASVEVLFLIGLTALAIQRAAQGGRHKLSGRSVFLWLYLLAGSYILATTTANLGIALRQKWMLMPALLALLLASIARTGDAHEAPPNPTPSLQRAGGP